MKNWLSTLFVVGLALLAMGWVWADEESELRERAEQERAEAEKAEQREVELREREALERREQARAIDREADELRRELEEALKHRDRLLRDLSNDHPAIPKSNARIEDLQRALERLENRHRERPHGFH